MTEILDEENWKPSSLDEVSVMVVDDDPLITSIVNAALKAIGISKFYIMNDPNQALDFVAEGLRGVDLLICDLMMPEVDGLTILKEVRKIKQDKLFLMLTADGSSESVSQAVELGVSDYMIKPFSIEDLQAKVRRLIIRAYGQQAGSRAKKDTSSVTNWN